VDELKMPTVKEIEEAAVAQVGLTDFGTDSYRDGLGILLNALGADARLNARGEAFIYQRIIGYLAQRLQVEDWYRRHPEIDEVPIVAPLIGLGLPRTGSTALSMLLAQDPSCATCVGGSRPSRVRRPPPCRASIRAFHRTRAR
jgi:hypothetical protein